MNEHYLGERRVATSTTASAPSSTAPSCRTFLERNFAFEKAYTGLEAFYRQPYRMFVRATFPFRSLIGRIDERVRALYELERVVRAARMRA